MGTSGLLLTFIVASGLPGAPFSSAEIEKQEKVFRLWWNDDFEWKFKSLPAKGGAPKQRIPYSGYIYLDKDGGTANVMRKWDAAVNEDYSYPATSWEQADTSEARSGAYRGFFGRRHGGQNDWYGHCNGWSAAAIRHAEPEKSVRAFGAVFTPSDIKGLLAEIYMYNDIEMLAGYESQLNPGLFHAILANWVGRGSHPVAMDSDPGKEKWNYPIYAYASSYGKHSAREIEVRTNIAFCKDTEDQEYNRSPAIRKFKSFHYMLTLNGRGKIVGGYYFNDSDKIDFVWVPLQPKASGEQGNEGGNPHLDVDKVMAIWRKSVPLEKRRQWLVIDPSRKDRSVEVADPTQLLPRNIRIVPPTRTADAASPDVVR